ncbi:hypothetical protein [Halobaculum litoreum]|uniref:hypothetical protein n=1 Tax=Halobaculum litoreum TaxID=3031998 RepID=UPI0024C2B378|nr:hypothetical protein [Halobaculum sp. DT92]
MRPRIPATEALPVATAVTAAGVLGVLQPLVWPSAPGGGIALALLTGVVAWVLAGQVPAQLETAVARKADLVLGLVIAAPATAVVVAAATGRFGLARATVVRALVALGTAIVPVIVGTGSRAQQRVRTEAAHATAEARLVYRWHGLAIPVGVVPVFVVVSAALGEVSVGGAVGIGIGMVIAARFGGDHTQELTVVDSAVVFDKERSLGATYVPWSRLSVAVRDDTVRLRRRYYVHSEYRVSCADSAAAEELARTIDHTRQPRSHH